MWISMPEKAHLEKRRSARFFNNGLLEPVITTIVAPDVACHFVAALLLLLPLFTDFTSHTI
jgi:hypothetical protein